MRNWGKRLLTAVLTIALTMGICGILPQAQVHAVDIGAALLFFDEEPGIGVDNADNRLQTEGWAWDGLDTLTINEKVNTRKILQIETIADHQTIHLIFNGNVNLQGIYGDPKGSLVVDGAGTLSITADIVEFALSSGENLTLNSGIFQIKNLYTNGFAVAAHSGNLLIGGSTNLTATSAHRVAVSGETGVTIKDNATVTAMGKERGISAPKGSLLIGGNTTVAATATGGGSMRAGIWSQNGITIEGNATVTANTEDYLSNAIASLGAAYIGGNASVTARATGYIASGIEAKGITINGSAVVQVRSDESAGLYSVGANLTIGGNALVVAQGGDNGIICLDGNVIFRNGARVSAQADSLDPDVDSAAIRAYSTGTTGCILIRDDADVTAVVLGDSGFALSSQNSAGLGTIQITGGTVRLTASDENHEMLGNKTTAPTALSNAVIVISDQTWTGQALTPDFTVKIGAATLNRDIDYHVSWRDNVNPGTATVIIEGVDFYTGTASKSFSITEPGADAGTSPDGLSAPIAIAKATVKIGDRAWTGKAQRPALTLAYGGKSLLSGRDYTAVYKNNVNIGKATVVVTGKGDYTGSRTLSFKIIPKKPAITKVTTGVKRIKVVWNKAASAQKITKYQLRYRVKGKGKWTTKTLSAKTTAFTITKLQKGKTYQIQLRSRKTVSKVHYYSAWSQTKTSRA